MIPGPHENRPLYRRELTIGDLTVLTTSVRNEGEDTVETYYRWRERRAFAVARGFGGAALALLTAWLIPFLKDEYRHAALGLVIAPLVGAVALGVVGLVSLLRMDAIHLSFVRASGLLQWLRRSVRP
jgi:hypothetical protein